MVEYTKSDEGGTDEARGEEDMQSSDKWSRRPSEEGCDIGSTDSGMFFSKSAAVFVPMYMCTINNKTCALQHTTGCKDERNIVVMRKFERISQHGTQNVKTHNRTKYKLKKISNTDPTKHSGMNSGAHEGYAVPASYKTPNELHMCIVRNTVITVYV